MTLYEYIHEYDFYDDLMEACASLEREYVVARFDLDQARRSAERKVMFENADYVAIMEASEDNFFARIGKAIEKVITAIGTFVKTILDRLLGKGNVNKKKDEDVLAQVRANMGKNPNFDAEIVEGIKEGKFTLHDVAQFADDYKKVMELIEHQKEDAPTVKNKVKKFCDKVQNSTALKITGTITAVLGAITLVGTSIIKVADLIGDSKNIGYKMMSHNDQIAHDTRLKNRVAHESVMTENSDNSAKIAKELRRSNKYAKAEYKLHKAEINLERKQQRQDSSKNAAELKEWREFETNMVSCYSTMVSTMSRACMMSTKEYRDAVEFMKRVLRKHGFTGNEFTNPQEEKDGKVEA